MRAHLLSIGTELLIGSTLDTNAQFIAKILADEAVDVFSHETVGDNIQRIADAFSRGSNADLIISTGGLGPTEDDASMRGLARFLGEPLIRHIATEKIIKLKYKKMRKPVPAISLKQCLVPRTHLCVFQNQWGTAPGVLCRYKHHDRSTLILVLPGPPREMRPMLQCLALPYLKRRYLKNVGVFLRRSLKIACTPESTVAEMTKKWLNLKPPVTVGIYAKPSDVELKIMSKASTLTQARRGLLRVQNQIEKQLGHLIYGADEDRLSDAVGRALLKHHATLSIAESCTAGLVSALITETAGSSAYFLGGVAAYRNSVKSLLLGVPPSLLSRFGAVSAECAQAMALGAQKLFGSDYAISVTGIAGPSGGSRKKPVGLVFIGLAGPNAKVCVIQNIFSGNRFLVRHQASIKALNELRLLLIKK